MRTTRLLPLLALPLIAAAGLIHARLVGALMGHALTVPPSPPPTAQGERAAPSWHRTAMRPLLGEPAAPLRRDETVARSGDPYEAPSCSGLRATTVAVTGDVTASFATLEGGGERGAMPRRQGDRYGARVVWLVAPDRVWLSGDDGLCQVPLSSRAAPIASASTHVPATVPSETSLGIERRGPDDYVIDRRSLEALFEQGPSLAKGARVVFEQVDGRTAGVRVTGIRAGDPLASLGLENGDRIERVAGVELTGPDKALEAYARVGRIPNIAIVVRRGDKVRTVDVTIR